MPGPSTPPTPASHPRGGVDDVPAMARVGAAATRASPTGASPAGADRPTVLVVDDAAADRDLHCLLLRSWGLQPVAAADGWEGLVCARTLLPALVVSDLRMPELDGWGLLARLRAGRETARIPVLLVTGDAGGEGASTTARRAHAAGAAGVLTKPIDFAAFQATTARLLAGG